VKWPDDGKVKFVEADEADGRTFVICPVSPEVARDMTDRIKAGEITAAEVCRAVTNAVQMVTWPMRLVERVGE
jgi:hypothetical protein